MNKIVFNKIVEKYKDDENITQIKKIKNKYWLRTKNENKWNFKWEIKRKTKNIEKVGGSKHKKHTTQSSNFLEVPLLFPINPPTRADLDFCPKQPNKSYLKATTETTPMSFHKITTLTCVSSSISKARFFIMFHFEIHVYYSFSFN